jgi:hypothetical protein
LLLSDADQRSRILPGFADRLAAKGPTSAEALYIAAVGRAAGSQLGHLAGPWDTETIAAWLEILLVDSARFATDPAFRAVVETNLPRALSSMLPRELRRAILDAANRTPGVSFDLSERLELAVGEARRSTVDHEVPFRSSGLSVTHAGAIESSLFSMPSSYYRPEEARDFVDALAAHAPEREILVLADGDVYDALEAAHGEHVHVLNTHGRSYSPWVRDPVLLARDIDGSVVLVQRPYEQPGREHDSNMGREIIQQLPEEVARVWTGVSWMKGDVPFHNGQILLLGDTVWVSLHTFGRAIIDGIGGRGVPTSALDDPGVVDQIVGIVREAASGLGQLYGRQVRFVHELPDHGSADARVELLKRVMGGGGYDLDSLLTLLPGANGEARHALVGSISLGSDLLRGLGTAELTALQAGYGLGVRGEALRGRFLSHHAGDSAVGLERFLDAMAADLQRAGIEVQRIPLILAPVSALADRGLIRHADFLINWNNVVLQRTPERAQAEGFGSLLAAGDALARQAYEAAGYELILLPPLITSVLRNGGYRCSSNHLTTP